LCPHVVSACCVCMLCLHVVSACCVCMLCLHVVSACCVCMLCNRYSCRVLMKFEFSGQIFDKYTNTNFHENTYSES